MSLKEADWNLDDCKGVHESEEHWMLRREFMERIKHRFPKMRVLCLSQVFANMEILGCRYPSATMELVRSLSEGICEEYRKIQSKRLQPTFVKASTAAERKAKKGDSCKPKPSTNIGVRVPIQKSIFMTAPSSYFIPAGRDCPSPPSDLLIGLNINCNNSFNPIPNLEITRTPKPIKTFNPFQTSVLPMQSSSHLNLQPMIPDLPVQLSQEEIVSTYFSNGPRISSPIFTSPFQPMPTEMVWSEPEPLTPNRKTVPPKHVVVIPKVSEFSPSELKECNGLVILEEVYKSKMPSQILSRSCVLCDKKSKVEYLPDDERGSICKWQLGKQFMAEGIGPTREVAKRSALANALTKLKQVCHTIQIKEKIVGADEVRRNDYIASVIHSEQAAQTLASPQNSIGNKMLRDMGWTGGALGKNGEGITEIIDVSSSIGRKRHGLGITLLPPPGTNGTTNGRVISQFSEGSIKNFLETTLAKDTNLLDIVFAPEFSPLERQAIHVAAQGMDLKSKSYGNTNKRQLVVSRRLNLNRLVDHLLDSGETPKYRLIKPYIGN